MSELSQDDIDALQSYQQQMQALGDTPQTNLEPQPQAMQTADPGPIGDNGFQREDPYPKPWQPDGSKLLDLPGGGAMVRDPNGATSLVSRAPSGPSSYSNTIDSTSAGQDAADRSNDIAAYKAYLARTGAQPLVKFGQVDTGPTAHTTFAAGVPDIDEEATHREGNQGVAPPPVSTAADVKKAADDAANLKAIHERMAKMQAEHDAAMKRETDAAAAYAKAHPMNANAELERQRKLAADWKAARVQANFAIPTDDDEHIKTLPELGSDMDAIRHQNTAPPPGNQLGQAFVAPPPPYDANGAGRVVIQHQDQPKQQGEVGDLGRDKQPEELPIDNTLGLRRLVGPTLQQLTTGVVPDDPADHVVAPKVDGPPPTDDGVGQRDESPPSPPTYVPGGWGRTNSPGARAMIDEALGQPREAQLAAQYAEFQKFNVEAQKAAAQRSAEAQAEQERQRLNQQRAAAVQQRQKDDLDVANKAYQDAKVDPDRFYKNRSTGANILSSIGVALGAFGASLNHTPNFALESVNKAIDNDMESQKEEIKKLGARSQNQLQQMRDATGSNEAADNAFRIASLQYAQSKAAEVDTTGKGAALQKMFGDEIQRTKLANALHRENTEKYIAPQMVGGGGAAGVDEKDLSRELQLPDEMAGMPAGTRLIAKDAKSADQLRTIVGGYSILKGLADKAAALQAKYGADIYVEGTTGWNAMVALRTNALSQAGHVNAVARQPIIDTEEMKEQLTPHLYNALGVGPSVADRWNATVDAYGTSATSILRTHAPEVDHRYIGRTPSGRIVPQAEYTGDTPMPHAMPRAFKPITGSGGRNPRTVDQRPDVRAIPEPKPKGQSRGGGRGHNPPPSERETDDEADGEEP